MNHPRNWDIRPRAMLIAALPAVTMAIVLIAYFTSTRLSDLEEAHSQRGKALARQLAAISEYGLFSGNLDVLRSQTNAILQEKDVTRVAVFGPAHEALADSSKPNPGSPFNTGPLSFRESVTGTRINLEDAFTEVGPPRILSDSEWETSLDGDHSPSPLPPRTESLGEVLVEISQESLLNEEAKLLRNAFLMAVGVLLASLILALRMSRGIARPILHISATVASISQGDMKARAPLEGGGSLHALAQGVNEMADRLSATQEDLERKVEAATRELLAKKEEAEVANRAKSRFLAAASHDLRQPMHALGLFVAELVQKTHTPDTHKLVEQIATSTETMENLLDSLLDISRLDAGVLDREIKPFPLQRLLERIEVDYLREARLRGQRLRIRPTDHWVESDPLLLERILHNLISNAMRYSPGGTILVACRKRGAMLRIEVRDNGPGIAPEAQQTIFQEFVQLHNPERNRAKGLGLGLAIVRRLTNLLGHPLFLRSRLGRGSVFAVDLPITQAVLVDIQTPPPAHAISQLHVALIDDDELAIAGTASLLESWDCQVSAADTPEAILARFPDPAQAPDVLLCDYQLGGRMNGLDVINTLHIHFGRRIPAVILSGDTTPETLAKIQQAGIPLLSKPVRPAKLRALLQRTTQA
jgi:two-component system, sensor histidine kinase